MNSEFIELLSKMAETDLTTNNLPEAKKNVVELETFLIQETDEHTKQDKCSSLPNKMPAYLKEQIITRTKQPDMQMFPTPKRFSKRLELFFYGCKVTGAVAASLMIMFATTITQTQIHTRSPEDNRLTQKERSLHTNEETVSSTITKQLSSSSQYITTWLKNFSSTLLEYPNK